MQKTKEATPTTKEERAALTATIRMREKEVSEEKKRVDLLHGEYSYEVRIAMQDQHQLRGGGASTSQDARLVSHHRNPIGGFFIGMDGQGFRKTCVVHYLTMYVVLDEEGTN